MHTIHLKSGREKSLARRHPWVFSGAIGRVEGSPGPGETVAVKKADGKFLGWGGWSPASQIQARIWSFSEELLPGRELFRQRITQALALRRSLGLLGPEGGCRLVHGESDGLPGLIVDRYGPFLVCQFLAACAEGWREELVEALAETVGESLPVEGIYERSDVEVRQKEGLPPRTGLLWGRQPPEEIPFQEGACRFLADVRHGHKTGFYLDQRDNRQLVAGWAQGREVLNCFSYTGGFGIAALKAGAAAVTQLDASTPALALGVRHARLNGLPEERLTSLEGNAFELLRRFRDARRSFDLIVLDPPKFADSVSHVERAARAYKDVNLLGFKLLRPGGILATFSCSGGVDAALFQKIVADAALDAGREAKVVRWLSQAGDHPVALPFPEGSYLKGLICRVE